MSSQLRDLPLRGILIYVVNTICFSVISLLVKELSIQFSISELLLVRFFCTFLGMALLIQFKGGFPLLRTRKALDLAIRTASGMIAIALSFIAFSGALLAEAGAVVVCGGMTGVMEQGCKGAKSNGGITIGILPGSSIKEANE